MKTIGLLGGMSWESTASYYSIINQKTKETLGGLHSAKIVLNSVNFAEIEPLQHHGDWPATAALLIEGARSVEAGGADFLLICTNTMHKVAAEIEQAITIPLLHIADATAAALQDDGIETVGLLGTSFTMEHDFYKKRLTDKYGISVLTPPADDRQIVHQVIYQELCLGKIIPSSREKYLDVINNLSNSGAQGVILGCTEIALLVQQNQTNVPLYDTTRIHAEQAVRMANSS